MVNRRDIYIRLENVKDIVDTLDEIKQIEKDLKVLFSKYDEINQGENKLFENWSNYIDDIDQKLDHIIV